MVSNSSKNGSNMASEDHPKIFLKSTKNMKLSTIFGGFWGLNDLSYLISEDTFQ